MAYFRINEIDQMKESNLDNIKCVEQYKINQKDYDSLRGEDFPAIITVKNHEIVCQNNKTVRTIKNLGKLPRICVKFKIYS